MKKIFFLIFYNVILVFSSDISDIEFGNDNHLDIITWNIEWFPKNGQITLDYVSEILQALDADINSDFVVGSGRLSSVFDYILAINNEFKIKVNKTTLESFY